MIKHDFEYIVTSDSDVAFDDNFVQIGIKYFYSENINRLGFVNSLLVDYYGDNFYNNGMAGTETVPTFSKAILQDLNNLTTAHMYGACSIIKREFLQEVNNGFFCDMYEDWYTRVEGIKRMWKGLYTPLVYSQQSMENDIYPTLKRYMRNFDWKAKYFKKNTFNKFDDEYSNEYLKDLVSTIFYFPLIVLNLFYLAFSISLLIVFQLKSIYILIPIILTFLYKIIFWIKFINLLSFRQFIKAIIVMPFWMLSLSWKKLNTDLKVWLEIK